MSGLCILSLGAITRTLGRKFLKQDRGKVTAAVDIEWQMPSLKPRLNCEVNRTAVLARWIYKPVAQDSEATLRE